MLKGYEYEFDITELSECPYALAKKNGIYIMRSREFEVALVAENGSLAAALFTDFDGEEFTFDVAVAEEHRRKGLARKLVDYAIDRFEELRVMSDDIRFVVEVVSPMMEWILDSMGFVVTRTLPDRVIMEFDT